MSPAMEGAGLRMDLQPYAGTGCCVKRQYPGIIFF
jgi:hypothetical protein